MLPCTLTVTIVLVPAAVKSDAWGNDPKGLTKIARPMPVRQYALSWPQVWEHGRFVERTKACSSQEFAEASKFMMQIFEDTQLHVIPDAHVGFLGAVLEETRFGKNGPIRLVMIPALPGSLQIALTLMGCGMLDIKKAGNLNNQADQNVDVRLPLSGLSFEDFTAAKFVSAARSRLGVDRRTDLQSIPQEVFEQNALWQAADELRMFQNVGTCGTRGNSAYGIIKLQGALVNVVHGYATNYYHFVTEQVPGLLAAHGKLAWLAEDKVSVLYLGKKWQKDYAMYAGFTEKQLVTYNPCKVYKADWVYTVATQDSKGAELLLLTRAMVLPTGFSGATFNDKSQIKDENELCFQGPRNPQVRVLLLARDCSGSPKVCQAAVRGRVVSNHAEILQVVQEVFGPDHVSGAAVCNFHAEDHSVASQAAHFEAADVVIGVIGAGLTNLIYMRAGSHVVALHPAHPTTSFSVYSSRCGQSYFWHMSVQLGLHYYAFACHDLKVFQGGKVDASDLSKMLLASVVPAVQKKLT
eukprot:gnl/MRDRNA2_/MRDRNA2_339666_c0_seq1.p1 gnl/MRDRNA2_/MRDRNA2_339666_c0~~gnl/MRDRNA2_/MRDRNA2_339666_c0_seq1.p1  ORF type:complete len:523 (-),score=102.86 gnl/MRDRNA2_/MRDRNA2_339666_c0_seq1:181-1749(-)